jgi:hypothetical protein
MLRSVDAKACPYYNSASFFLTNQATLPVDLTDPRIRNNSYANN